MTKDSVRTTWHPSWTHWLHNHEQQNKACIKKVVPPSVTTNQQRGFIVPDSLPLWLSPIISSVVDWALPQMMKQLSHLVFWFLLSSNHSSKLRPQNTSKLSTNQSILHLFHTPGAISCNWSAPARLCLVWPWARWPTEQVFGIKRELLDRTKTIFTQTELQQHLRRPSSTGSGTLPTRSSKVKIYEHLNTLSSILVTALWENKHHLQNVPHKLNSLLHVTKSIYF